MGIQGHGSRNENINTLPLDYLLDSLFTHEILLHEDASKKKKDIKVKATMERERRTCNEIALLIRKFNCSFNRSANAGIGEWSDQKGSILMCFKCRNLVISKGTTPSFTKDRDRKKKNIMYIMWEEITKSESNEDSD